MNKKYHAVIPLDVIDNKKLTPSAKLLYGEITAICDDKGLCFDGNSYFSDLFNVSKKSISKWMKELENECLIKRSSENDIFQKLKDKSMKGLGYGNEVCEWCGVFTSVLHKHHYPIPKSKGGTDTVSICPNCHHEFHYNQKVIELIIEEKVLQEIISIRCEANGKSI